MNKEQTMQNFKKLSKCYFLPAKSSTMQNDPNSGELIMGEGSFYFMETSKSSSSSGLKSNIQRQGFKVDNGLLDIGSGGHHASQENFLKAIKPTMDVNKSFECANSSRMAMPSFSRFWSELQSIKRNDPLMKSTPISFNYFS